MIQVARKTISRADTGTREAGTLPDSTLAVDRDRAAPVRS